MLMMGTANTNSIIKPEVASHNKYPLLWSIKHLNFNSRDKMPYIGLILLFQARDHMLARRNHMLIFFHRATNITSQIFHRAVAIISIDWIPPVDKKNHARKK